MAKKPKPELPTARTIDLVGLSNAGATLSRIEELVARFFDGAAAPGDNLSAPIYVDRVTQSYRDAVNGEMRVLRAQLYSTGLFSSIECKDL